MLEKIKSLLGLGKVDAAALIRDIIKGHESQDVLFAPENAHVLKAYVEYGHKFSHGYCATFLETADRELVKIYLETGFELDDNAKSAVIARKDDELTQLMIDSGSWAPFPYGSCLSHPGAIHHDHHDFPEESVPAMV